MGDGMSKVLGNQWRGSAKQEAWLAHIGNTWPWIHLGVGGKRPK